MTLPEGWRELSLPQIAEGGLFTDGDWVESKDQDPDGRVRLTQLADVGVGEWRNRSNRWLREDQAARLSCTFIQPGDVLVARMPDPIGRACIVPEGIGAAVTVVDVAVLRIARRDVDPAFAMWALNSPTIRARVEALQSGTTRKRISRKNLATIRLSVPPLDEQRRIVEILEEHLSRLDSAAVTLAQNRRRLRHWVQASETMLLRRSGAAESPVADVLREPLRNGHSARAVEGGVVRVVTLTAITKSEFVDEYTKMTAADPARVADLWLRPGDVLVERSNTRELVGTSALYRGEPHWAIFPDLAIRLRADTKKVSSEYLALAVGSETVQRYFRARAKGLSGSMPKIDQETIGAASIPVPSLAEQARVVEEADALRRSADRIWYALQAADSRAATLRGALLQAAFSGQLTGRASDMDRAEELVSA